ncbi:MAG: restriction endonuclease subunit S [Rickettsiales bacterium]|nr:restriction endonuclease subunit S [Rickettsiales bacterium]
MDTREWKEYKFKDIFTIEKGKELVGDNEDGKIPLISSTESNNGFCAFISNGNLLFDGNKLTVASNGSVGSAFYQQQDFYTTTDVNILTLKNYTLNKYIALFFCSIIEFEKYKFGYGRKWNLHKMLNSTFSLPTTTDNQPDWQFMEDFIKKIYNKVIEEVKASAPALLSLSLKNRPVLKCDEWKEFMVGELFDVVLSAGDLKLEECEAGETPLISSGETNNGIVGFITKDEKDKSQIFKNCITIDMFCNAYYQPFSFYAVSHGRVNMLVPKQEMSKFVCLFICAVLNNEEYRFNYGRAVYSNTAENITLNLPTTPQGEPDFEWMERYIRRLIFG